MHSEQEPRDGRTRTLRRLIGDASLVASLNHGREYLPSAPEVDIAGTSRSSFIDVVNARIEARLGINLETAVRRRVLPGYCTVEDGGHKLRLPVWLARDLDAIRSDGIGRRYVPRPEDPLRLRLDREDRLVSVTGGWNRRQLMQARFSPRVPSEWRQYLVGSAAREVVDDFKEIFRVEPPDWAWLRRMRQDPVAVEREASELWERFLEHVPLVLRIPGVELGVAEFQVLCEGPDGGRDRRWFAEGWPAAALFLLQRGAVKRAFGQVERNRANAKQVAAATLCCSVAGRRWGRRPCERALYTASRLPRFKHDAELAELFRNESRFSRQATRVRGVLMHLNHETQGHLLRRLGSNSRFVRPQVEFAIRVGMSPLFFTAHCHFEVAKFVVRILAGGGVDPTTWTEVGVEAGDVAQALATVSADALAAFAARRLEAGDGSPGIDEGEEMSNPFETGVLALLLHLRNVRGNPPTPRQLCEFARRTPQLAIHQIEKLHATGLVKEQEWPPPPGWREGLLAGLVGATATPITSIGALRSCGRAPRELLAGRHRFRSEGRPRTPRLLLDTSR